MKKAKPAAKSKAKTKVIRKAPENSPEGRDLKVRKLLQLTGAGELGKQIIDSMMDQFQRQGNLPPGFVEKFKERAEAHEIIELIVPIYIAHLDESTLAAAIEFYESPAGKKFSAAQPQIVTETTAAGQRWGMELAQRAVRALEEDEKGIG